MDKMEMDLNVDSLPGVSIVIPTYNRAHCIRSAISSALNDDYPNLEVVVIDNASSDNTVEILKEFEDYRLRIILNKATIHVADNWNLAIRNASHNLVLMLHSDDELINGFITKAMAEYLKYQKQYPIITGFGVYRNYRGKQFRMPLFEGNGIFEAGAQAMKAVLFSSPHPSVSLIEKKCYEVCGYFGTPEFRDFDIAEEIFLRLYTKFGFIHLHTDAILIGGSKFEKSDQLGNNSWAKFGFIDAYSEIKQRHIALLNENSATAIALHRKVMSRALSGIFYPVYRMGNRELAVVYIKQLFNIKPLYAANPKVLFKVIRVLTKL